MYESAEKLNEEYGHVNAIFATKSKGISLQYNGKYDLTKAIQVVCWDILNVAIIVLFITSSEKMPDRNQCRWLGLQVAQIACAFSPNLRSIELNPQVYYFYSKC